MICSACREYKMDKLKTQKFMPCKLGSTAKTRVRVDLRQKYVCVGRNLKIKELDYDSKGKLDIKYKKWIFVNVTKIYDDGFFFATY